MSISIKCPVPECLFSADELPPVAAAAVLTTHSMTHQVPATPAVAAARGAVADADTAAIAVVH